MTHAACLDFRLLKSRVPIERVLEARGLLKAMRRHGDNLFVATSCFENNSMTIMTSKQQGQSKNKIESFTA